LSQKVPAIKIAFSTLKWLNARGGGTTAEIDLASIRLVLAEAATYEAVIWTLGSKKSRKSTLDPHGRFPDKGSG